jgi:tetratricopeptide (TPR) repeat protein
MAKRVNKPFLLGLLIVPLVLGAGAILWQHFGHLGHGDAKKLLADGDRFFAAGDFEKARVSYAQASQADPTSTAPLIKLGDAASRLAAQDPIHLREAEQAWTRALSVNPKDTEAMGRLLDAYWDLIDLGVRSDAQAPMLTKCREWADRLASADPSNTKAITRKHIATVRQWLLTRTVPIQELT